MVTFIDAVLAGDARAEDIDDWIKGWRTSFPDEIHSSAHLAGYLGMTAAECFAWVEGRMTTQAIIDARRAEATIARRRAGA